MSETQELLRFPQSDGRTKVIDTTSGETWFEGEADDAAKTDAPRTSPFAVPTKGAEVVHLPEPKQDETGQRDWKTQGEADDEKPDPDMTQKLAHESDRSNESVPYPAGAPEMWNLLKMPFKKRANAMRLYQNALDAWRNMPALGTSLDDADKLERYFGALDAFDQFLACVARNPEAYRSWVESVDDNQFGKLFFAYISRFGLGEA